MVTIIVIGLILFIVGVGATYVHDHMKTVSSEKETVRAERRELSKQRNAVDPSLQAKRDKLFDYDGFAKQIYQTQAAAALKTKTAKTTRTSTGKRVVKPSASKTTFNKLSPEGSTTVEELNKLIDGLKKK